mmetsp:Transcript_60779/g.131827  ORF Transcript_60779/g.131827 Transcript_60779/m.131827 type:complete len:214 (-) Transcript_60779:604-1245(-)
MRSRATPRFRGSESVAVSSRWGSLRASSEASEQWARAPPKSPSLGTSDATGASGCLASTSLSAWVPSCSFCASSLARWRASAVRTNWLANCISRRETSSALPTSPAWNSTSLHTFLMTASLSSTISAAWKSSTARSTPETSFMTSTAAPRPALRNASRAAASNSCGCDAPSEVPLPSSSRRRFAFSRRRSGTVNARESASESPPSDSNFVTKT